MSRTQVPAALQRRIWATDAWLQVNYQSALGHFLNSEITYRPSEFEGRNTKGQNITYTFISKLTGAGVGEGGTLVNNEEALNLSDFGMRVGILRHAVKNPNDIDTIESVQTSIDFEDTTKPLLEEWMAERIDWSIFNQLAGNNATSLQLEGVSYSAANGTLRNVTGQNDIIPANRVVRPNNRANDQSLITTDTMTLTLVDYAIEQAQLSRFQMGYMKSGYFGELWISPEQYTDLKQDVNSPVTWYSNALAMASGGDSSQLTGPKYFDNQIRPVGYYAGVEIYVHPRVSYGVNSSTLASIPTVRRAVLVTKNALSYASMVGKGRVTDNKVPLAFKMEEQDYGYWKGIGVVWIGGIKKNSPSSAQDSGVTVIATYAGPHTTTTS